MGDDPSGAGDAAVLDPSVICPAIGGETELRSLTLAETQTWCTCMTALVGAGDQRQPDGLGVIAGYGAVCCGTPACGNTCLPQMTVSDCVANIRLFSCRATVNELDDCLRTIRNAGNAVGGGCRPFRYAPGCRQTVFQTGNSTGCPIQVR